MNATTFGLLEFFYPRHLQNLQHLIKFGTMHHVYCIVGVAEGGQNALATAWANIIVCERGLPCFTCRGCMLFAKKLHPDVHILPPVAHASAIHINDVRRAHHLLAQRPLRAPLNVLLLYQAEKLVPEATSALLKTLEEPPAPTLILLTTSAPFQLPATLRSRMTIWNMPPLPLSAVRAYVSERGGIPRHAHDLCGLVEGKFERIQSLFHPEMGSNIEGVSHEALSFPEQWWRDAGMFWMQFLTSSIAEREKMINEYFAFSEQKVKLFRGAKPRTVPPRGTGAWVNAESSSVFHTMLTVLEMLLRDLLMVQENVHTERTLPFCDIDQLSSQNSLRNIPDKLRCLEKLKIHLTAHGNKKLLCDYLQIIFATHG